jgi:antirestriction protein ArdC
VNKLDTMMTDIVDRVVDLIEDGLATGDWKKPWDLLFDTSIQRNAETNRTYNGINQFSLGLAAQWYQYNDPRWGTVKTWNRLGGHVKADEKGTLIVFWGITWACEQHGKRQSHPCCHEAESYSWPLTYSVFNAEQVEGAPPLQEPQDLPEVLPDARAQTILDNIPGLVVKQGGRHAFFSRTRPEQIIVPPIQWFHSTEEFYATCFHEVTHWTGHQLRLDRLPADEFVVFGSNEYAKEELCAELGSAWLMQHAGLRPQPSLNAAEYLAHWASVLKASPRILYGAAKEAQAAVDYVINVSGKEKAT